MEGMAMASAGDGWNSGIALLSDVMICGIVDIGIIGNKKKSSGTEGRQDTAR